VGENLIRKKLSHHASQDRTYLIKEKMSRKKAKEF
jgi:hypothetical protein